MVGFFHRVMSDVPTQPTATTVQVAKGSELHMTWTIKISHLKSPGWGKGSEAKTSVTTSPQASVVQLPRSPLVVFPPPTVQQGHCSVNPLKTVNPVRETPSHAWKRTERLQDFTKHFGSCIILHPCSLLGTSPHKVCLKIHSTNIPFRANTFSGGL